MSTEVETSNEPSPVEVDADNRSEESQGELNTRKLLSLGALGPAEVDRICAEERRAEFIVEGILPTKCIAIAGGESGIGKSALFYQLGLCVAAGIPFLNMPSRQGRVVYFDLENSLLDSKVMRDALVRFLDLSEAPKDFLLVTDPPSDLERLVDGLRPSLIIIDSLRAYRPDVTEKPAKTGAWLKEIRKLARKYRCTFLIIHHLRKPSPDRDLPDLEDYRVLTWLQEIEGPRALVNQTDARIAVAEGNLNPAAIRMKWSRRVHGDSPIVLLERVLDAEGDAAGYRHCTGVELLSAERRSALDKLPNAPTVFSFKEAKLATGRSDDPTSKTLAVWRQLGLVEKVAKGRYRKLVQDGPLSTDLAPLALQAPAVE